jgi:hypothetical protein
MPWVKGRKRAGLGKRHSVNDMWRLSKTSSEASVVMAAPTSGESSSGFVGSVGGGGSRRQGVPALLDNPRVSAREEVPMSRSDEKRRPSEGRGLVKRTSSGKIRASRDVGQRRIQRRRLDWTACFLPGWMTRTGTNSEGPRGRRRLLVVDVG